jgi:hypothetical protein
MSAIPHSSKYENQINSAANSNVPKHLFAAEQELPANCFTIDRWGMVEEGFFLEFNHPASGGKVALVLGEGQSYIMRDAINNRGCIYQPRQGRGFVRRASLGEMEIVGGKKFPLLRKSEEDEVSSFVLVCSGMPAGVYVREGLEPLYHGIGGTAHRVSWGGDEALVEMRHEETLLIFYQTGEVAEVHFDGLANLSFGGYKVQSLPADLALLERLKVVEQMFKSTVNMVDQAKRIGAIDRWFHELASMILYTENHPDLREDITKALGRFAKEYGGGKLNSAVRGHLYSALRAVGDEKPRWWLEGEKTSFSMIDHLGATERRGPSKEALARKKDRADRDREEHFKKKNPNDKIEPHHGNGKQKGGKNKK